MNGKGEIELSLKDNIQVVYLDISDTGKGIKKSSDIFKPGYTTKKYGWGLGLVLTKRIIEEYHKGKLILKQTGAEGTTFHIVIPGVQT